MKLHKVICMSAVATCIAFSALAQGLPKASHPEDVGFSSERLQRLTSAFQTDVDKGAIPGAVVLIAHNGKVAYLEAFGFQDREKKVPMSERRRELLAGRDCAWRTHNSRGGAGVCELGTTFSW
jgi:CubicO group peptidase (beta-lactamase class C family)